MKWYIMCEQEENQEYHHNNYAGMYDEYYYFSVLCIRSIPIHLWMDVLCL